MLTKKKLFYGPRVAECEPSRVFFVRTPISPAAPPVTSPPPIPSPLRRHSRSAPSSQPVVFPIERQRRRKALPFRPKLSLARQALPLYNDQMKLL